MVTTLIRYIEQRTEGNRAKCFRCLKGVDFLLFPKFQISPKYKHASIALTV